MRGLYEIIRDNQEAVRQSHARAHDKLEDPNVGEDRKRKINSKMKELEEINNKLSVGNRELEQLILS